MLLPASESEQCPMVIQKVTNRQTNLMETDLKREYLPKGELLEWGPQLCFKLGWQEVKGSLALASCSSTHGEQAAVSTVLGKREDRLTLATHSQSYLVSCVLFKLYS